MIDLIRRDRGTTEKGNKPMWSILRRRRESAEDGQILIMVAGGMVAMLLLAGLVIDAGTAFRERRTLQNASDLSSMAGTKVVADHYLDGGRTGADVHGAITASLAANQCVAAGGCTWTGQYVMPGANPGDEVDLGAVTAADAIPAGTQGVRVSVTEPSETFFMKVVGISEVDINTTATAMTSGFLNEAPGGILLPIAAFDQVYDVGTEYELTEGEEGPGNFGWLSWTGANDAPTLEASLCYPDNPAMTFPVWIDGAPGNMNSSGVRACLDSWIGETVLIPIWRQTNDAGGSNLNYEVVTLAAFTLTDYDRHASKIRGNFVEFYALPGVPAGYGRPPCNASDPTCLSRTNFIGLTK